MPERHDRNEQERSRHPTQPAQHLFWIAIAIVVALAILQLFVSLEAKREMSDAWDEKSADFTTGFTAYTPASEMDCTSLEHVPWHGNTYLILEKGTRRAITITAAGLSVEGICESEKCQDYQRWLCVEQKGYFGFLNTKTGTYIGHDNHQSMRATARVMKEWEYLTPRKHPSGGYQLLSPHWVTLRVVGVKEDGRGLKWAEHGDTVWDFVRV